MLRTITVGNSLLIQGVVVGKTTDGLLIVRVGEQTYAGKPVPSLRAA